MAKDDKKRPATGEVAPGTTDPTDTTSARPKPRGGVRQVAPSRSVTINVSPALHRNDNWPYGDARSPMNARPRNANPYDSIGNASRAASARFEARGAEMRERARDKETMSAHDYAMKHNRGFRGMYGQVQEFARQEAARQKGINDGTIAVTDRFNKDNWAAAGGRGEKIDPNDPQVQERIKQLNEWKDRQWQTTYGKDTGKSFNRYNENFDTSRIAGALRTNADGTRAFDFNNMTTAQLDMLTNVMRNDQEATGNATRDMKVAMANDKQKAVGEASSRLMDRGVRFTFDPKTGKRLQTDDQIIALDKAYRQSDAVRAVGDLDANEKATVQKIKDLGLEDNEATRRALGQPTAADERNRVFRDLTASGVDPVVARGLVTLDQGNPNVVEAAGNIDAEAKKAARDTEANWNKVAEPKNPPAQGPTPAAAPTGPEGGPLKSNLPAPDNPPQPGGPLATGVQAIDNINMLEPAEPKPQANLSLPATGFAPLDAINANLLGSGTKPLEESL